jgi:hypothetical protein
MIQLKNPVSQAAQTRESHQQANRPGLGDPVDVFAGVSAMILLPNGAVIREVSFDLHH